MWSEPQTISGTIFGTAGPGVWSIPLAAQSLQFYKDVRIVGIQSSLIVTGPNPQAVDAVAECYINIPPDKNQNFGSFGGVVYGWAVRAGSDISHIVEIDIPANYAVNVQGIAYLFAVAGAPFTALSYIDFVYKIKSFM